MKPTRPNVILIVSDDHGYADRSSLGIHPEVRTPGLDRLAAEGVECTEAYVTAPICSPSRAGLIAGQYQARWGARWFGDSSFPAHRPSLAEQFGGLGYSTGYLGKVHYGQEDVGDRGCPPHHGFDETYYGLAGKQQGRLNYLRHSDSAVAEYGSEASWRMAVQPMLDGDDEIELEGFLTDELGARARDFTRRHSSAPEPFFLMLAFNAVHNFCWQLPPEELRRRGLPNRDDWHDDDAVGYGGWYDGSITPNLEHGREYYLAQLELMDAQIGALLGELDDLGIADDTIVVYLTDNGGSTCNYADNTPLNGTKYTLWEGGIRVPFLVRWPGGHLPAGIRRAGMVSSMDLYPTVLSAAGADPASYADCDGLDQLDLLRTGGSGHEELHWDTGFQWAVRAGRWKLTTVDRDAGEVSYLESIEHATLGPAVRLHDLADDPGERHDLASQRPDLVARLTDRHQAWQRETGKESNR
ncbi:sulfatase [Kribbella catacumbae]|uniref:sulfatase family protein n=1 Tax=Kribbella catacumbae TaxID=460086 RepID=UPI00039F8AAA|nr:sulfatase-like hydrolase/transferase [Kribbella catacumbae]